MPSVPLVAVWRLHEDGRFREAFGKHLAPDVVEPNPLPDVTAGLLDHAVPVHVGQKAKAESAAKERCN